MTGPTVGLLRNQDLVSAGHAPDRATLSLRPFYEPDRSRTYA